MFCPNCGGASTAGLRFCKACGTNLEVVSQAISGQLLKTSPPSQPPFDVAQYSKTNTAAIKAIGTGAAFLLAAIFFFFSSRGVGIWIAFGFLMAAGGTLSKGIGELMTARRLEQLAGLRNPSQASSSPPTQLPPSSSTQPLSPGTSVTEQTTRYLSGTPKQ